MKHETLAGWNISVEKTRIHEPGEGNGEPVEAEGWSFRFVEMIPRTGDQIVFSFGREVRDMVVRELTGGIVLHGGELPRI